jgi:hypothetical protein
LIWSPVPAVPPRTVGVSGRGLPIRTIKTESMRQEIGSILHHHSSTKEKEDLTYVLRVCKMHDYL